MCGPGAWYFLHSNPNGRTDFAAGRDSCEVHDPWFCSERTPAAQSTWEPQSPQCRETRCCCIAGERKWSHSTERRHESTFLAPQVLTQGVKGSPFQSLRSQTLDFPTSPAGCVRACLLDTESSEGSNDSSQSHRARLSQILSDSRHSAPEATMGLPDTPPNKMKTSWAVLVCEETHIRLPRVATKSL